MSEEKLAIILLGAPGSGKGTQGELLEEKTGFKRYVMSSLIKEELTKKIKTWAREYDIESGLLLGDTDIFEVFREHFKSENKIILDGIPRTLDQAYWLYGFLEQHKYKIQVVFIDVDESKLLERILLRAKKQGRKDDNPQTFKERLKLFDKVKKVILEVYNEEIIRVNGDQSIEKVAQEVNKKLNL